MLWSMEISANEIRLVPRWTPIGSYTAFLSRSNPSWKNTLGDTFITSSFLGMLNHPFWDPIFSPPCGLLAAPYLQIHKEPKSTPKPT